MTMMRMGLSVVVAAIATPLLWAASIQRPRQWDTVDSDVTVVSGRITADGKPVGNGSAFKSHWVQSRSASGWKTVMTVTAPIRPDVKTVTGGTLSIPPTVSRVEDDGSGTPIRLYDAAGKLMTAPTAVDRKPIPEDPRIPRHADAFRQMLDSHRPPSEPIPQRTPVLLVAGMEKKEERRSLHLRRFGPATGRINDLDRYFGRAGDDAVEVLVDPESELDIQVNRTRNGALVSQITFGYSVREGAFLRERTRSEYRTASPAGDREFVEVRLSNVRFARVGGVQ